MLTGNQPSFPLAGFPKHIVVSFFIENKMKETFYFSHDYNAIQDPKLMALLNTCGLAGIGMYWILIELLHQQPESKLLYKSFEDYIEFYGKIDEENEQMLNTLKQVFINTELFVEQDGFISSKRVLENKKQRELLSEKRSLAGKKSAEIRLNRTNVQQNLTSVEQGKERKGKERKEVISSNNFEMDKEYTLSTGLRVIRKPWGVISAATQKVITEKDCPELKEIN